jgi:predicted permease
MFAFSPNWIMRNAPSLEPFGLFALFCALTALPAVLMIRVVEPELVLPAFSILLFVEAAIAAFVARLISVRENAASVTMWDFAGAFTFIGCAATIFAEPDQAVLFLEEQAALRSDSGP